MIKIIKKWIEAIKGYDKLETKYHDLIKLKDEIGKQSVERNIRKLALQGQLDKCKAKLPKKNKLEEYWNNRRIKKLVTWKARHGLKMDVRCFFQTDETLSKFKGTNDQIVADILSWTILNVKYKIDKKEYWQYAYETNLKKIGDCEDGAILMANTAINSGVPYWRIRLNKGWVKLNNYKGYHAFMTYLSEKDNKWKIVDWCYWPNESRDLKRSWGDAEKYFQPDSSWNVKFGFRGLEVK